MLTLLRPSSILRSSFVFLIPRPAVLKVLWYWIEIEPWLYRAVYLKDQDLLLNLFLLPLQQIRMLVRSGGLGLGVMWEIKPASKRKMKD